MTRINALRNTARNSSVAWGKEVSLLHTLNNNAGPLIFAVLLIACSFTVGCSSNDKPKLVSSNNQIPITQPQSPMVPAPVPAEIKPAPRKIVHKKPATVNYTDKNSGVTFEYPRRYAIETGDAANELLASTPLPMNFVAPGGVALAAVELPETGFANTDFSSAFFNVSVHKNLTAEQCTEFAVPQPKSVATSSATPMPSSEPTPALSNESASTTPASSPVAPSTETKPEQSASAQPAAAPEPQGSKLLVGDLELRATEAVSGEGSRQSDSKYFHVFQNGSCYEFGLNVTTVASEQGVTKHVDRDKVFSRLEQILSTVKITPVVATPEVTAETKPAPAAAEAPAQ